jgi:hypothetical protein
MSKQLIAGFGWSTDGIPEFSKIESDQYGLEQVHKIMAKARFGKGGGKAPAPPDPYATAAAQATANKETAIAEKQLNMVNQFTPYGSLEYRHTDWGPDRTPLYSAFQTLSPNQAKMKTLTDQAGIKYGETANSQMDLVRDRLSSPLDFGQLGPAPEINNEMRQQVADSMYQRMNPQFDRDQERLESQLINQGLQRGSEAWNEAQYDRNRAKNDAMLAIDNASLGQAAQLYGLEEGERNARINELAMQRSQPLNELAAMLTGSAVQNPQFVNTPMTSMNAPDIMGATYANYNGQMDAWKQNQANGNGFMSGLFGIGGSVLGAGAMPGGFLKLS